jgi:hypothetical protein
MEISKMNENENHLDQRTLDELFALLHHRRFMKKKLSILKAPTAAIEKEDEMIDQVVNQINSRWQESFDKFFSLCANCVHLVSKGEDMYCACEKDLPQITANMEPRKCEFFKKAHPVGSGVQSE